MPITGFSPDQGERLAGVLDGELLGWEFLEPIVQPNLEGLPEDARIVIEGAALNRGGRLRIRRKDGDRSGGASLRHLGILVAKELDVDEIIVRSSSRLERQDLVVPLPLSRKRKLLDQKAVAGRAVKQF